MIATAWKHLFGFSYLSAQTVRGVFSAPLRVKEIIAQIHFVAIESLPMIILCVCAAAMVTIIEASFHMKLVIQNDSMVPGFASALILRELGTVVMALLITSRVGAGVAAEVGTMKITEQIDALKMLGLNIVQFLVVPRFIACVIAGALLSLIANTACLAAAVIVSVARLGYTPELFVSMSRPFISLQDIYFAIIKGAVFGAVIPLFACYSGFNCKPGAEGVGLATTNAVVSSSLAIIGLDFMMSYLMSFFY